ncbi:hypothetical protein [Asticcacaulis sp. 201]|uniref:hypothetical protein n=1 Tax=Asticcacaulis sp. 201 TaxID=3028787 RepID=UPI0029160FCA|nr:hypothetical protein [Asticcacaulis sp. 201]MDV6329917.1 hypothetical protein [Asticcacaulis sp. 201]
MSSIANLRGLLLFLIGTYFPFLLIAYLMDGSLSRHCAQIGVPKRVVFVARSYVSGKEIRAFVQAFRQAPGHSPLYLVWLKAWSFISFAFIMGAIGIGAGVAATWSQTSL